MEEVTKAEEAALLAASKKTLYKVAIPVTAYTAEQAYGLVVRTLETALNLTKGFTAANIDILNSVRLNKSGEPEEAATKHRYIRPGAERQYKKMSKEGVKTGKSMDCIEAISDSKMLQFETEARKYGIEYALTKDKGTVPPTWTAHFWARDKEQMSRAFNDYTRKVLGKEKDSPLEVFKRRASRVTAQVKAEPLKILKPKVKIR